MGISFPRNMERHFNAEVKLGIGNLGRLKAPLVSLQRLEIMMLGIV